MNNKKKEMMLLIFVISIQRSESNKKKIINLFILLMIKNFNHFIHKIWIFDPFLNYLYQQPFEKKTNLKKRKKLILFMMYK